MEIARRVEAATRVAITVVAVLLIWQVWTMGQAGPRWPAPADCRDGIEVDGLLRCPGQALVLAQVCPGSRSLEPLQPGDAIDCQTEAISRMVPEAIAGLALPVDINAATSAELQTLPRVGPVTAERISSGRPYSSVSALLEVRGIGPKTLAGLEQRARIRKPGPDPR